MLQGVTVRRRCNRPEVVASYAKDGVTALQIGNSRPRPSGGTGTARLVGHPSVLGAPGRPPPRPGRGPSADPRHAVLVRARSLNIVVVGSVALNSAETLGVARSLKPV